MASILDQIQNNIEKLSAPASEEIMKATHRNLFSELSEIFQSKDDSNNACFIALVKGLQFVLEQIQVSVSLDAMGIFESSTVSLFCISSLHCLQLVKDHMGNSVSIAKDVILNYTEVVGHVLAISETGGEDDDLYRDLSNNSLTGSVPQFLEELTSLKYFLQEALRLFTVSIMDAAKSGINQQINLTPDMVNEIKVGLKGENLDLPSGNSRQWNSQSTLPKNQPLTCYGIVIGALCMVRKTVEEEDMMKQMVVKHGLTPGQGTLVKLFATLRVNSEIWKAVELIEFLEKEGHSVGFESYELVVEGCVEKREYVLAGKVAVRMIERGFIPYIKIRHKIVEGLVSIGEWEIACSVRRRFAALKS
ncbi:hypothetical protein RIF29_29581 [Crotalaria pallida]|uniref:Pentatricopeptide repeat-containing protein n=1 Tax=Crotalaria pallida TaxID=3830 RepID=A0AAN9EF48_CROPI